MIFFFFNTKHTSRDALAHAGHQSSRGSALKSVWNRISLGGRRVSVIRKRGSPTMTRLTSHLPQTRIYSPQMPKNLKSFARPSIWYKSHHSLSRKRKEEEEEDIARGTFGRIGTVRLTGIIRQGDGQDQKKLLFFKYNVVLIAEGRHADGTPTVWKKTVHFHLTDFGRLSVTKSSASFTRQSEFL